MMIRALVLMFFASVAQAGSLGEWEGVWMGTCQHIVQGQVRFQFYPTLIIQPISSLRYQWRKDFPATQTIPAMVKDYEMAVIDEASGRYLLDEKDGFTIPMQLQGTTLVGRYEVSGMNFRNEIVLSGNTMSERLETYQGNPQQLSSVQACTYQRSSKSRRTRW